MFSINPFLYFVPFQAHRMGVLDLVFKGQDMGAVRRAIEIAWGEDFPITTIDGGLQFPMDGAICTITKDGVACRFDLTDEEIEDCMDVKDRVTATLLGPDGGRWSSILDALSGHAIYRFGPDIWTITVQTASGERISTGQVSIPGYGEEAMGSLLYQVDLKDEALVRVDVTVDDVTVAMFGCHQGAELSSGGVIVAPISAPDSLELRGGLWQVAI